MFIEGAPGFHDKQGPWFLEKVLDGGYLSVLLSGTLLLNTAASSSVCSESNEVSCCRLGHISVTALMQFSCRLHWLLVHSSCCGKNHNVYTCCVRLRRFVEKRWVTGAWSRPQTPNFTRAPCSFASKIGPQGARAKNLV